MLVIWQVEFNNNHHQPLQPIKINRILELDHNNKMILGQCSNNNNHLEDHNSSKRKDLSNNKDPNKGHNNNNDHNNSKDHNNNNKDHNNHIKGLQLRKNLLLCVHLLCSVLRVKIVTSREL